MFDLSINDIWDVLSLQKHNTRLVVLSATLLGASCGAIGSFLLLRKRSLMGDALAHATLPGIGIVFLVATLLGLDGKSLSLLLAGASITGILGMGLVLMIRKTTRLKDDAAMGIVLSVFFGIGVAVLGIAQNTGGAAAGLESFIYGKTASMVKADFWLIASVSVLVCFAARLFLKELTILCFDDAYARSQGWPVLFLDLVLISLVTAVTIVGLQAVGLILIIAFLITPAAAARFWTQNLVKMLIVASVIGAASGWLGASLSALLPRLPAGAVIVLVGSTIFLGSMFFGRERGVLRRYLKQRRLNKRVGRQHVLRAAFEILEDSTDCEDVANHLVAWNKLKAHRSWSEKKLKTLVRWCQLDDAVEDAVEPGHIQLSEKGFAEASRVTRNHRLWELYLIRYADIAPSHVDRDADMVEHVLGAEIVKQLEAELSEDLRLPKSPHAIEIEVEGGIK